MVDTRFFTHSGVLSLTHMVTLTGAKACYADGSALKTDNDITLHGIAPLDTAGSNEISFLDNPKYLSTFKTSRAGACFVVEKYRSLAPANMILLVCDDPYRAFAQVAQAFYPPVQSSGVIAPSASVDASAVIGNNCTIGANAFIGEQVELGDNCIIQPNAVIEKGVVIGNNSYIGANTTISHALIGHHVIIHRGVNIGQDGFGFAMSAKGHLKVPQLGRVIIENEVEIGAGTCIDRGSTQDTLIGAGTKIDNLVQIGHNVVIGKGAIVVAQVGISGSTHIGNGTILAGQAGVAGHLHIGNGVKIAAQSGVMENIADGATVGGSPCVPVRQWHKQTIALARMAEKKGVS